MAKIYNYDVPEELIKKYVKFRIMADGYLSGKYKTSHEQIGGTNKDMIEYERNRRWLLCVELVMKTHREICNAIGVEYTEEEDDKFRIAFRKHIDNEIDKELFKQTDLKGDENDRK